MKRITLILLSFVLTSIVVYAQVPEKINYQAVIRNSTGELVSSQDVGIKVSILNETTTGSVIYSEQHTVATNAYGQIAIEIGDGTNVSSDFSAIDWGVNDKFLKLEVDINGGTSYVTVGTSQMLSVPYALYANDAGLAKVADMAYSAEFASTSGIADFAENANFTDSARVAGMAYTADVLGSNGVYTTSTDTLFVVKDHDGNVVFAVFPDGAQIIVNETAKGKVGGFAVSGRSPAKAVDVDILKVTTDSTRIYVNDTVNAKGKVGGFAVSGRSPSKSLNTDLLFITADSTRIYVNENTGAKGKVGGFAVSGRSPAKGPGQHMFLSTTDSTRIFTQDAEGGFGVRDNSTGSSQSYLQLTPSNYFIGHESGVNITSGSFNSFMGYKSGQNTSTGDNNVFLGYQTGYNNTEGFNNVFIGYNSGFSNIDGYRNVFIGYEAGYDNSSGFLNTFIGNVAGTNNTGGAANTIIGNYAGYNNLGGDENVFLGQSAGFGNESGSNNIYIGRATAYNNAGGSLNTYVGHFSGYTDNSSTFNVFIGAYSGYGVTDGTSNVFIGKYAGYNETSVSDKLIISNSQTKNLIEGDFSNDRVTIRDVLKLTPRSTEPSNPVEGEIYVNSVSHHIYCYLNGIWVALD